jgi:hypothetical protein
MVAEAHPAFDEILDNIVQHRFGKFFVCIEQAFVNVALLHFDLLQSRFELEAVLGFDILSDKFQRVSVGNGGVVVVFVEILAKGGA